MLLKNGWVHDGLGHTSRQDVLIEDGRIAAMGTHEELLQSSGIYREVYESQQKGVA